MNDNCSWQPSQHVVFSPLDDGVAVLDAEQNIYYSLDGIGPFLWSRLIEGQTFAGMCKATADSFDVDEVTARVDIAEWIESMTALGLIAQNNA